eukprot:gnl/MRDRNA2_/MRDRNA2_157978_c0_seq1.p1 gnl/MRDRNA2_/MRDRNA2_157978_c0~~gnl/MRDRNA2_/MRDRNA2_157978_c0_seq1.p1  ORF type:complete len:240 (-),score=46.88 gnl/MRDRNA2_/MRDRNA2_157978_c0_seq1:255-974(-)
MDTYQDLRCNKCGASQPGKMTICKNATLSANHNNQYERDGYTALCETHAGLVGCSMRYHELVVFDVTAVAKEDPLLKRYSPAQPSLSGTTTKAGESMSTKAVAPQTGSKAQPEPEKKNQLKPKQEACRQLAGRGKVDGFNVDQVQQELAERIALLEARLAEVVAQREADMKSGLAIPSGPQTLNTNATTPAARVLAFWKQSQPETQAPTCFSVVHAVLKAVSRARKQVGASVKSTDVST